MRPKSFSQRAIGLWFLVTLIAGCARSATVSTPSGGISETEYSVISSVIEAYRDFGLGTGFKTLVVRDHTGLDVLGHDLSSGFQYLQEVMPGLSPEIINDFEAKNRKPYALEAWMQLGTPYVLISEEEIEEISSSSGCRDTYRGRYPDSSGPVTVSIVGFNARGDKALVYVGGSLCRTGGGVFVLMTMEDGVWTVQERHLAWIS